MKQDRINILKMIPRKTRLIGISGFAHSGKDSFAKFLKKENKDIKITSFAKPIKKIMIKCLGFTKKQVYDQKKKEKIDRFWEISPRKLMQLIGTEMFRKIFRDDIWIKVFDKKFRKSKNKFFIIPDVRFDNEAEAIKRNGGVIIKIERKHDNVVGKDHESEKGIDEKFIHIKVDNNGSLSELKETATSIINILKKG